MDAAVAQSARWRRVSGHSRPPSTWHDSRVQTTTVTGLWITAVKGTRLRAVDAIALEADGARGNRRFFVIDDRDRMVNGKSIGALQAVVTSFDERSERLAFDFPDGSRVDDEVRLGAPIVAKFFSGQAEGSLVEGPWASALSGARRPAIETRVGRISGRSRRQWRGQPDLARVAGAPRS